MKVKLMAILELDHPDCKQCNEEECIEAFSTCGDEDILVDVINNLKLSTGSICLLGILPMRQYLAKTG